MPSWFQAAAASLFLPESMCARHVKTLEHRKPARPNHPRHKATTTYGTFDVASPVAIIYIAA